MSGEVIIEYAKETLWIRIYRFIGLVCLASVLGRVIGLKPVMRFESWWMDLVFGVLFLGTSIIMMVRRRSIRTADRRLEVIRITSRKLDSLSREPGLDTAVANEMFELSETIRKNLDNEKLE